MGFKSDIEIAQETQMAVINEIAEKLEIHDEFVENYGKYKAKIDYRMLKTYQDKPNGKLILVTAINPTPAGEGKTTTTVGLGDALSAMGKKTVIALREPSLGPVFGVKGGAAGGGYAQVVPMEDINLHFTGDMHAIGAANNLLAAMIDNHIQQGNALGIDPRRITWKRCVDMNDRQLRYIVSGLHGKANGTPREDGFDITVASEIMAILCLSSDIDDLKNRASSLCNNEHLLLAVFLQQYNHTINEYVHGFNKIPSLVSIDTDNKSRLVELIDFFDSFPLLFNGEIIKPSTPK